MSILSSKYFFNVIVHPYTLQAIKLEKILHDRNSEIDALKSRLTSEMSCSEEVDVMNTPPPKVSMQLKCSGAEF